MGKPFRIATFDGGGICGLYSVGLMRRIIQQFPGITDSIDLFAGTSTGGLIALSLAANLSIDTVRDLYLNKAKSIFAKPLGWRIKSVFGAAESKYSNKGLIKAAYEVFGGTFLGELPKKVVVPAFDLCSEASPEDPSWRTRFFHNLTPDDKLELVSDIAVRTASAPTFFPSYQGYVDGGVFANFPALVAVSQAMEKNPSLQLEDIRLLAVGTGGQIKYISGQDLSWGAVQWIRPILDIFMGAQSLLVDSLCKKLLSERYCRLSPAIPGIAMDDVSRMGELVSLAENTDLGPTFDWVEKTFLA
jgi:patatin-like phospholipase/acyl hydrolase